MSSKSNMANPTKIIAVGYCIIILIGALLLMLPISSREGTITPFIDALFTATSSTCVTGLVVYDTYSYWSVFGQMVILFLIQVGGIGFMTIAIWAVSLTKKKIGIKDRYTMAESVASPYLGGAVRLSKAILWGAILVETIGALLLSITFIPKLGLLKGIYFSFFHSVSAFCNAGIDLMGIFSPGSSLITVSNNYLFVIVIAVLIITGGLGFFVWTDIFQNKKNITHYKLHTKIVLSTTIGLIIAGTVLILLFENNEVSFENMNLSEKILTSFFQSVSPRTAGFNTIDLNSITESSQLLIICLMFIGGSPGSTAGGIKTTAFLMMLLTITTIIRRKKAVECFGRRIDDEALRQVCCIIMMYLILILISTMLIADIDNIPIKEVLFETTSAVGTVGLSLGITSDLSSISRIIIILLMYFGRMGGITVLLALTNSLPSSRQLPQEKIAVG